MSSSEPQNQAQPDQAPAEALPAAATARQRWARLPQAGLGGVVVVGLQVMGLVVAILSFGVPIAVLAQASSFTGGLGSWQIVLAVAAIAWGLSLAAILVALAVLVQAGGQLAGLLARIETHQRHIADALLDQMASSGAGGGMSARSLPVEPLERIVSLLEEIRENSLLSEPQRQARWQQLMAEQAAELQAEFERLVGQRQFDQADRLADQLERRLGRTEQAVQLRDRLRRARAEARSSDLAETRQRIDDLMSLAHWDQAEQLAAELAARYPDFAEAAELGERVRRERAAYQSEQVRRLQQQIQQAVAGRQWRQAVGAAEQLVEKFPNTSEAQAVKESLQTLRANAEIQTRRELEQQIKDLIKRQRYDEALRLAGQLIETYPDSPQADVLRSQLPRLEQRARSQRA